MIQFVAILFGTSILEQFQQTSDFEFSFLKITFDNKPKDECEDQVKPKFKQITQHFEVVIVCVPS